jgi:hypothetical protein
MDWKHSQLPCRKKFKSQPSAGTLMLLVFGTQQGPVLEHHQERATRTNSEMFTGRLKPAIQSECQGLVREVLLHDIVYPDIAIQQCMRGSLLSQTHSLLKP